jgi:hypothetical protein
MTAGIGARVWVPKEAGWAQAVVIASDGSQINVRRAEDRQEVWLDSSEAYLCNTDDVEVRPIF